MDQIKTGKFLQTLRKEKGFTQEQLSERLGVTRRTVSRWETGNNMPDLDILIELSDLYEVDLREILNGERKSDMMNKDTRETLLMAADYKNESEKRRARIVCIYFVLGIVGLTVNFILNEISVPDNFLTGFLKGFTFGMPLATMGMGLLYTTGRMEKIREFKEKVILKKGDEA
ncbi:MAG: helix-turn-helix transcriptional regulator [Oscillospiraceae bacterium]|nr:helix-turn-helix transcriptional regulator [Oscillospiraceae bacterium]